MSDLKLTAEEERLILRLRAAEERERRDRALALRRIKAAYDFAQWMETEGHGPSYSTFCDDFGYEAGPDEPRPRTYEIVMDIIELVRCEKYQQQGMINAALY